jgi:hypothetical protein
MEQRLKALNLKPNGNNRRRFEAALIRIGAIQELPKGLWMDHQRSNVDLHEIEARIIAADQRKAMAQRPPGGGF